jgi:hypothetical protein
LSKVPLDGTWAVASKRLADEAGQVNTTRTSFIKLAGDNVQQRQAAELFFGQFRTQHLAASQSVKTVASKGDVGPFVIQTSLWLDRNARAYRAAAMAKSMTFDLVVGSAPPGAALSYRRTGDVWSRNTDPTNTTLKNLLYAMWTVRAELPGHAPQEKDHDPWREENHVITFSF